MKPHLINLKKYITSSESENANDDFAVSFFRKVFGNVKKGSSGSNTDIYVEGRLVVELKTYYNDWASGLFQALHYHKKGISYSAICVIAHRFIGLWKVNEIPRDIIKIAKNSDINKSPSEIGVINSKKINRTQQSKLIKSAVYLYKLEENDLFYSEIDLQIANFEDYLLNLDSERTRITPNNFIQKAEMIKKYFENPIDAVHVFYNILPYWDTTSKIPIAKLNKPNILLIFGKNRTDYSDEFTMHPKHHEEFRNFVENHYVSTNEEEGISIDYYFSRFDELLSAIDADYSKQHGIYFTDINLSRFALWFIREKYGEKKLSDKYIVFDPAGGSGNLVSSWRKNHLKFKIISELNPDLLKTIEMRLNNDPVHYNAGFSIIPKTFENKGLNFLDKSANAYIEIIKSYLHQGNKKIDKPFAFLLNPPYKNTDEHEKNRIHKDAEYNIDTAILEIAGNDAGKERYLAFLTQILLICKNQVSLNNNFKPIVCIFTPIPWLIPRPTFQKFRIEFDKYFKYQTGFIILSNEFFKLEGRFPISFTIWQYSFNELGNKNNIKVFDYTHLKKTDLSIPWHQSIKKINTNIKKCIRGRKQIIIDNRRGDIRSTFPDIGVKGEMHYQPRYNMYRNRTKDEKNQKIVSGFPLLAKKHHEKKSPYGYTDGSFIGFMMDGVPCRLRMDTCNRFTNKPDRIWFKLDNYFKNTNFTAINSGPPDKYGFCSYDLISAKAMFSFYSITKVFNGIYPVWANQFDIWPPNILKKFEDEYYSLSFAYCLAENRCVVTKFEKNNPVNGVPEIYVDNPLCPTNPDSFWLKTLDSKISRNSQLAIELVSAIKKLYQYWNIEYCKGQIIENCGLDEEPYFKYFSYPDFVTPYSGLIQIRKYAEKNRKGDISKKFETIKNITGKVKERLYTILVDKFKYFD